MAASPMDNSSGPIAVSVKMDGTEIADTLELYSARVWRDVNRIPEAEVQIVAGSVATNEFPQTDGNTFKPGAEIEVLAGYDAQTDQIFKGVVTGLRLQIKDGPPMMILRARDKAITLTRVKATAFYEAKKDSDIATQIIGDAGLTAAVTATSDSARNVLRHQVSDWEFLRQIADRNGQVITIDDGTVTCDAPDDAANPVLTLTLGEDISSIDTEVSAETMISEAGLRSWDSATVAAVDSTESTLPGLAWGNLTPSTLSTAIASSTHHLDMPGARAAGDMTQMAKGRLARASLSAMQGTVEFQGSALALPGKTVELKGVGDRFGGTAFVSGVTHEIEGGTWKTEVILGLPAQLRDETDGKSSDLTANLGPSIHGLQIATVVTVADDPDGLLRIQVELKVLDDPPAKVWARIAQPYASSSAGMVFLPEVGDEVVVAFLGADPDGPVVLGALHNGTNARPDEATADNFIKTITSKIGLKIEMDEDKKTLTLSTPEGGEMLFDDTEKLIKITDQNGSTITMNDAGIALKTDKDITLEATGNIDIKATGDATMNGANVTAEGQSSATVKGGGSAELSASGQTTVKGATVAIN